jgi:two-component system, response regulator YesN
VVTFASELYGRQINWRSFDYYPALTRIRRYTEERYKEDVRLETAARIAGMEATYFSSFFRKKVGIRFTNWLWYVRVSKAMDLLAVCDEPIHCVAYSVGFTDLRTFERAFKRITGMTAREFKRLSRPA